MRDAGKAPESRAVHVLSHELPGLCGVTRQRFEKLILWPDFPAPEFRSVSGEGIWLAAKVRAWNKRRVARGNRKGGRPRKGTGTT